MTSDGLTGIADNARGRFDAKHKAREQALALTREVIRLSANAIRNVHRGNFAEAEGLIAKGRANLDQTEKQIADQWNAKTDEIGRDAQLAAYKASLGITK